ncbi:MAG: signal recognition particle protein, partial [Planctomycetaceae bacterium]
MIDSMTMQERLTPEIIDRSRRNRIARGSGVQPADISKLLKDFSMMSKMMQGMSNMGLRDRLRMMRGLSDGGFLNPGAEIVEKKLRSGRGPADKDAARD